MQEIKQGFLAIKHAGIVRQNIRELMRDPSTQKLLVYKRLEKPLGMVTLGRYVAIAQFPCCTCIGRLPALLKSEDLHVGTTRKGLGLRWNNQGFALRMC